MVRRGIGYDAQQARYYKASVDRTNLTASHALRELTGQMIYEPDPVRTRDAWRTWWADEQGYSYSPGAPPRKRKVASVVYVFSCFAAGTPVRTLLGPRPIESIRVGDQVLAQDVTTERPQLPSRSSRLYSQPAEAHALRIDLGGEVIVATPIHRFWKAGRGWVMARDLRLRRHDPDASAGRPGSPRSRRTRSSRCSTSMWLSAGASSSELRAPWCMTTVSSIRSSIRSMPRRGSAGGRGRRLPAEGLAFRGREPVADGPRSIVGRVSSLRAMRPQLFPCCNCRPGRLVQFQVTCCERGSSRSQP